MIKEYCVETSEQIAQVATLATEIWNEYYTPIIGAAQVAYMVENFQSTRAIAEQIRKGMQYYVVELDGQVVAYYGIMEELPPSGQGNDMATLFLSKIYVLASARRKGLASWMLARIAEKAQAQGYTRIALTVNRGNAASIAFYEHSGFVKAGELVQDIGNGFVMDDYRMVWKLIV